VGINYKCNERLLKFVFSALWVLKLKVVQFKLSEHTTSPNSLMLTWLLLIPTEWRQFSVMVKSCAAKPSLNSALNVFMCSKTHVGCPHSCWWCFVYKMYFSASVGSVAMVAGDSIGNLWAFSPYADLWRLRLGDSKQAKVCANIFNLMISGTFRNSMRGWQNLWWTK
jgi:hypothetical protein